MHNPPKHSFAPSGDEWPIEWVIPKQQKAGLDLTSFFIFIYIMCFVLHTCLLTGELMTDTGQDQ